MNILHTISVCFLILSAISFLLLVIEVSRHPQKMTVMNFVWPITALYFGPFGLVTYYLFGRSSGGERPFWQKVWNGVTHCGAGCTLGDIIAEWIVFLSGITIAGSKLAASYTLDFTLAYLLGVLFQYYSIAPMRGLSGWPGIKAALKADTISLIAFEVGLFAFMFWMHYRFHPLLEPDRPEYWFLMQLGMIIGFGTSYPANWWLIRRGWKEAM